MLKRSLVLVAALGLFGLIGFAVAQQNPQSSSQVSGFQKPINSNNFSLANRAPQLNRLKSSNELSGGWILRMNDGEIISADLAEEFSITLDTQYGEVAITSDQIISLRIVSPQPTSKNNSQPGISTPAPPRPQTGPRDIVIATAAGDIISGRSNFDSLKLKLKWGTATADSNSIDFVCNRKFGVMTVVNDQDSPSYVLTAVQLDRITTRIIEQARASRVVSPGRLLKAPGSKSRPQNMME